LYNSLAATSNQNNNIVNKDTDNVTLSKDIQENLAQFSDPSMPHIDHSIMTIPNPLTASNLGSRVIDVKNFLERPVLCPAASITWNTSLIRGTILMQMSVPSLLLNETVYKEKISGFYGFKGDLVLKFQTNAQKFQQGMVLISVLTGGPMITIPRFNVVKNSIVAQSQLPSVRHDISTTNETVIKVPYSSPMLMHPLDPIRSRDYATVFYTVYSPLSSGTISYKCWCHFENVELLYPMAQSGKNMRVTKRANRYTSSDQEDTGSIISTPVSTIASGVRQLGDNIPLISSFSQPTAWFLDSLSKGFAAFGLSNPVDTSVRHSFVPRIMSHPNNIDVNDTVDSFGYIAGNKVAHLPGFAGTDVDEMSIQHLSSIPSYLSGDSWSDTQAAGTEILTFTIGKVGFYVPGVVTTGGLPRTYRMYAPFAYVANRFMYWRGSIKYKFYCVKTNFHNGRLVFAFNPNYTLAKNTYANSYFNTRYIWDISQVPTFEITIPYVNPQSWTYFDDNSNIGTLKAFVLTELEGVSGVASTVEIITEISAGPDFEVSVSAYGNEQGRQAIMVQSADFAIENTRLNYSKFKQLSNKSGPEGDSGNKKDLHSLHKKNKVFVRYAKQNQSKKEKNIRNSRMNKYSIYAQSSELSMGGFDDDTNLNINQNEIDTAGYNSLYTTGEAIKSLRQTLKRSNLKFLGDTANTAVYRWTSDTHMPFYATLEAGQPDILPFTRNIQDDYDYFSGLFAFFRGGIIYRAVPHATTAVRPRMFLLNTSITAWSPQVSTADKNIIAGTQPNQILSSSYVQGAIDAHVPFYSPTHTAVFMHCPFVTTYTTSLPFDFGHKTIDITMRSPTANTISFDVTRQIADDFSMGGFIGVLPVLNANLPSGTVPLP